MSKLFVLTLFLAFGFVSCELMDGEPVRLSPYEKWEGFECKNIPSDIACENEELRKTTLYFFKNGTYQFRKNGDVTLKGKYSSSGDISVAKTYELDWSTTLGRVSVVAIVDTLKITTSDSPYYGAVSQSIYVKK